MGFRLALTTKAARFSNPPHPGKSIQPDQMLKSLKLPEVLEMPKMLEILKSL